jgi:polyisoprenoid-binding protein YceI
METAVKTKWSIDPTHSEVQFKIKHLVISTVTGQFNEFSGSLESEDKNFNGANARFEALISSISTNNSDRDAHLKSADFFDADNYPTLKFESREFTHLKDNLYKITGDFTIKGITKEISLDAEYGGSMIDFYGNEKAGFEISGKINRKDFGLTWSAVTEAGGVVVSDEVKLQLNVQFSRPI